DLRPQRSSPHSSLCCPSAFRPRAAFAWERCHPYNPARHPQVEAAASRACASMRRMVRKGGRAMVDREFGIALLAEFVGPFALVLAGVGAIISTQGQAD